MDPTASPPHPREPPGSAARWWLPAPALLSAIAVAQLVLSEQGALHRWKGGGFAMFASREDRVLQVHVADGARCLSHQAVWPEELALEQQRLAIFPTARGLRSLGDELGSGRWLFYFDARGSDRLRVARAATARRLGTYMAFPARFDAIEIDAYRLRFRPAGEDLDGDGVLDEGEDVIANGYLDAPLVVPERIARWSSRGDRESP